MLRAFFLMHETQFRAGDFPHLENDLVIRSYSDRTALQRTDIRKASLRHDPRHFRDRMLSDHPTLGMNSFPSCLCGVLLLYPDQKSRNPLIDDFVSRNN
jgi:hypothetical protein